MVAIAATGEIAEDDLFDLVRRAYPFRNLARDDFDAVAGDAERGDRYGARPPLGVSPPRPGARHDPAAARARLAAITSGGAIPDLADYDVIEEPAGTFVGKVHEDFAVESMAGDIFLLGNQSWRIRRVEAVEGPGRGRPRRAAHDPLLAGRGAGPLPGAVGCGRRAPRAEWRSCCGTATERRSTGSRRRPASTRRRRGRSSTTSPRRSTALGRSRRRTAVIAERFFDEAGGMQLVLHTPFGGRINRAWGLALRKRFCVTFDFELQAAATDDGIVLSLGEQHSFPLESVFRMVRPAHARSRPGAGGAAVADVHEPLALERDPRPRAAAPRGRAARADAAPAHARRGPAGRRLPRQVACRTTSGGPIVPPDHPLVNETIDNCLHEAMDIDGSARDPRAASTRRDRGASPSNAGALADVARDPQRQPVRLPRRRAAGGAARARRVAAPDRPRSRGRHRRARPGGDRRVAGRRPGPIVRDAEELHDVLLTLGVLPAADIGDWRAFADDLIGDERATMATWNIDDGTKQTALIAAERIGMVTAIRGPLDLDPPLSEPPGMREVEAEEAVRLIVQGWLEALATHHGGRACGTPRAHCWRCRERAGGTGGTRRCASRPVHHRQRAARPVGGWINRRGGMVRAAAAGTHPSHDPGSTTPGDRASQRRRLHPLPAALAARRTLHPAPRQGRPWSGDRAAPGARAACARLGGDGSSRAGSRATTRSTWSNCAFLGSSHGDGSRGVSRPMRIAPTCSLRALRSRAEPAFLRQSRSAPRTRRQLILVSLVTWNRPRGTRAGGARLPGARPRSPSSCGRTCTRSSSPALRRWSEDRRRCPGAGLSSEAREVADYLARRGASFLSEIARGTGRVPAAVENGTLGAGRARPGHRRRHRRIARAAAARVQAPVDPPPPPVSSWWKGQPAHDAGRSLGSLGRV